MGSTRKEAQPGKGSAGKRGQPDDKGNSIEDMEWDGLSGQHGTDKQPEEGKDSNSSKSMNTLRRRMPCDRAELISLSGHSGAVYSLSWSCNQRYLLSSSADCSIRLWSLELGSNLVSYRGHSHPVWAVQASPQVTCCCRRNVLVSRCGALLASSCSMNAAAHRCQCCSPWAITDASVLACRGSTLQAHQLTKQLECGPQSTGKPFACWLAIRAMSTRCAGYRAVTTLPLEARTQPCAFGM